MIFVEGDIVKVKKIKEDDQYFDRFRQFIGEKFKIINRRAYFTRSGDGFLYKIRSRSATLNLVPGSIFLLKRRGQLYKRNIMATLTPLSYTGSSLFLDTEPQNTQSFWITATTAAVNTQTVTTTTRFANTVSSRWGEWAWDDE